MPRLTDTQTMVLAHASQRDSGSIYPLPATLAGTDRASKAVAALVKTGFAGECETSDAAAVSRTDGDIRHGVFVTTAGLAAIGIDDATPAGDEAPVAPDPMPAADTAALPDPLAAPRVTKAAMVLALLRRDSGATLAELVEATGWLPHTTRAALTGLRKQDHVIDRGKRGDVTCYRIAGLA